MLREVCVKPCRSVTYLDLVYHPASGERVKIPVDRPQAYMG